MPALTVKVSVRAIAVGGNGVGEVYEQSDANTDLHGITAFVPYAAVGEKVHASVVERKERFLKTEFLEVIEPSSSRVEPHCEYFGSCGGCELQHISYDGQVEAKQAMLVGALRSSKCGDSVLSSIQPMVRSEPYLYRRRIHLHISSDGRVGFYQKFSRSVVSIDNCPIASMRINKALESVQEVGRAIAGKVSSLLLEEDERGVIAVAKSPYELSHDERHYVQEQLKSFFDNFIIISAGKEVGGLGKRSATLSLTQSYKLSVTLPAGSFSQVNWPINLQLIDGVLSLLQPFIGKHVLDLYAGAGNFSLPIARAGAMVTAVECDKRLVNFGRESAARNRIERLEYIEDSVERYLRAFERGKYRCPDVLIVDPPRNGLGSLVSKLPQARTVVLISCHLPSFVRDLNALIKAGWQVKTIKPYDMFPQTAYMEIVALLERSS